MANPMIQLTINARFKNRPLTGVERFAFEVEKELKSRSERFRIDEINPGRELAGFKGHGWEQFILPFKLSRDRILFSPCNTGPLAIENQLVVIHDAAVWDFPGGFSRKFGAFYRALLPLLAKRARYVATVSEFSRERLALHLKMPRERIIPLGNAISAEFCPSTSQGDKPGARFFCVCSLEPRKNFETLLRAWGQLEREKILPEGSELRIAGGANPRNFGSIAEIEASETVKWLGRIGDEALIEEYQTASAFIFPSLYEGFGLPPLEALACGCPVLLSNAASLPEVGGREFRAGNDEGAVIYFDPESVEATAATVETFLKMPKADREKMASNALARSSEFTWKKIADRVEEAILGGGSGY